MKIYIPTYNRADIPLAGTLKGWPKDYPVHVVVRKTQIEPYERLLERLGLEGASILPIGEDGIANTRNAILRHAGDSKFAMIDDDLGMLIRRSDHDWKLRGPTHAEFIVMMKEMEKYLDDVAHVAISCREGNNRILEDHVENNRGIRLVAYRGDVLRWKNLRYDTSLEGREDLDMTLRLMEKGYKNIVLYKYAQGQKGSNTTGGLNGSDARKDEAMERTAKLLQEKHKGFVRARTKMTKTAWGGGVRWDVTCYWKRAFASSQRAKEKEYEAISDKQIKNITDND